jgi:hypothetical protein
VKKQLEEWTGIVTKQHQISPPNQLSNETFQNVLSLVPSDLLVVANSFVDYEKEVDAFVKSWLPHLTLWNSRIRAIARYNRAYIFFIFHLLIFDDI